MQQEQTYLGWCVPAEHPRGYRGEKNVTLSQNENTLWCQIRAFLSNPHTLANNPYMLLTLPLSLVVPDVDSLCLSHLCFPSLELFHVSRCDFL